MNSLNHLYLSQALTKFSQSFVDLDLNDVRKKLEQDIVRVCEACEESRISLSFRNDLQVEAHLVVEPKHWHRHEFGRASGVLAICTCLELGFRHWL